MEKDVQVSNLSFRVSGLEVRCGWIKTESIFLLIMLVMTSCGLPAWAGEPALPSGLDSAGKSEEPQLPAGLGGSNSSQEPQLPQGLEQDSSLEEPGLPDGLEQGQGEEPALPSGLSFEEQKTAGQDQVDQESDWPKPFGFPLHGFLEGRLGPRLQSDAFHSKDATLAETRLQLETSQFWKASTLDLTADLVLDGITEEVELDPRQARFTFSPLPSVDIRVGRQVLSWGTGDLLFINDLFPKDWISFLSGRDVEYLKAPGDAVRIGWFNDLFNLNLVYTPKFDPDRFVEGERFSYWNPRLGRIAGKDNQISTREPDDWFDDDEIALRAYRTIAGYELALYSYFGYWKSPAGQDPGTGKFLFPELNVYGASLQGTLGPGIGNIEFGYYDSREDRQGDDPLVKNSELRLLIGYEQELAREFTGAVQYYLEHLQDYDAYRDQLPPGVEARDENRHLLTLRLTKLLLNQDLTLS